MVDFPLCSAVVAAEVSRNRISDPRLALSESAVQTLTATYLEVRSSWASQTVENKLWPSLWTT